MSAHVFVQYLTLKAQPAWRHLPAAEREAGRAAFARQIEAAAPEVTTYAYATLGLKAGTDLLLWRLAPSPEALQDSLSALLLTGLGAYLDVNLAMTGMTRPSTYVRKPTTQEQAILEPERMHYLTVYPFSKTVDWYLMSKEARQGMMNEHMRIGHDFPTVRQLLVYSFGMDDQEFIVAYETDDLPAYQSLVMALREAEGRRYTLKDTPIHTGVYRPLPQTLALLG
ncbi:MAG: chlorite dismutase [Chloroflexi bacterium]|nr:chlorite dismutase [Chloroflexota bacterium]